MIDEESLGIEMSAAMLVQESGQNGEWPLITKSNPVMSRLTGLTYRTYWYEVGFLVAGGTRISLTNGFVVESFW